MNDKYILGIYKEIKEAVESNDKELVIDLLNKVYENGFEDGTNNK